MSIKTRVEFWWLVFLTAVGIGAVTWLFVEGYRTKGLALMGFPYVAIPSAIPCLLLANLVSKRGQEIQPWERKLSYVFVCTILVPVAGFLVVAVVFG